MPDLSHTLAFNVIKGAVRNALDGHPKWTVPQAFAHSVAKRAAGTLMEHLHGGPSLLASARRSGQRQRLSLSASGGEALPSTPPPSPSEAFMTINGHVVTEGQAMTVRVAIEAMARDLVESGLGDDEHGKIMTEGYLARIDELRRMIADE